MLNVLGKTLPLLTLASFVPAGAGTAQDLIVMSSRGPEGPVDLLASKFEAPSMKVTVMYGPSAGNSPNAIPTRLSRNEPVDVVIMVKSELEELVKKGVVVEGSQVDMFHSRIGMAVRSGASVPDISTVAAFKQTLLSAKSVAYSDSVSGRYIESEIFKKLDIQDQLIPKSKKVVGNLVGSVVAKGDAEIGFQQMSELKAVPGITIVGPIPDALQKITIFSAGIVATSQHKDLASKFVRFMNSSAVCPVISSFGIDPTACIPSSQ